MTIEMREIFEGWKNFLQQKSLSPDQLRVAEMRLESCSNCVYARKLMVRKVIDWIYDVFTNKNKAVKGKVFSGFYCQVCSCPLDVKVLSPATKCPLPIFEGKQYPHKERWSYVHFNENGKLTTPENVFITSSTDSPESLITT